MKYYNPSNNFRAPIPREPKPYRPPRPIAEIISPRPVSRTEQVCEEKEVEEKETCMPPIPLKKEKKFELSQDDLVILGVMFLLILNSCDDYLLLAVLGYLFLSGQKKRP